MLAAQQSAAPSSAAGPASATAAGAAEHGVPNASRRSLARWRDSTNTDIDVQLQWHSALPGRLPDESSAAVCTLLLCVAAPPLQQPEFFEARLQLHHLVGGRDAWDTQRLKRLMRTMEQPAGGGGGNGDSVQLRRELTRVVIDVVFRDMQRAAVAGDASISTKAVEILNAYPCTVSARSSTIEHLRLLSQCQRTCGSAVNKAENELDKLRKEVKELEVRQSQALEAAKEGERDLLRRFAVLLEEKLQKERALLREIYVLQHGGSSGVAGAVDVDAVVSAAPAVVAEAVGKAAPRKRARTKATSQPARPAAPSTAPPQAAGPLDPPQWGAGGDAAAAAQKEIPQQAAQSIPVVPSMNMQTLSLFDPMSSDEEQPKKKTVASQSRPQHGASGTVARSAAGVLSDSLFHSDDE